MLEGAPLSSPRVLKLLIDRSPSSSQSMGQTTSKIIDPESGFSGLDEDSVKNNLVIVGII